MFYWEIRNSDRISQSNAPLTFQEGHSVSLNDSCTTVSDGVNVNHREQSFHDQHYFQADDNTDSQNRLIFSYFAVLFSVVHHAIDNTLLSFDYLFVKEKGVDFFLASVFF